MYLGCNKKWKAIIWVKEGSQSDGTDSDSNLSGAGRVEESPVYKGQSLRAVLTPDLQVMRDAG